MDGATSALPTQLDEPTTSAPLRRSARHAVARRDRRRLGIMAERLTADAGSRSSQRHRTGATLYVLITVLGPLSRAHFNPAVNCGFRAAPRRPRDAALYAGADHRRLLGTPPRTMFDAPPRRRRPACRHRPVWFSEGVAAFRLVLPILGGFALAPAGIPGLVSLYVVAAYWFTASTSFANPAVTIARALTPTFSRHPSR